MKIGDRVRRLRMQRGLTQEELANRCELSKGFISLLTSAGFPPAFPPPIAGNAPRTGGW